MTAAKNKNRTGYRTFVCYRGETSGTTAGSQIAAYVQPILDGDDEFAPAFYAPEKKYDFMSDLPAMFEAIEKVVIVFTVGFFRGFFLEDSENGQVRPNPESSTRLEIELALKYHCDIYPIFSGEFSWDDIDPVTMDRLNQYYGAEAMDRLKHISNPYLWNQVRNTEEDILASFKKSSINNMWQFLRTLPAETERDFELKLTEFAKKNNWSADVRKRLKEILEDQAAAEEVRYAAFYLLQLMLRQIKDFPKMKDLFDRYAELFSRRLSYSHIWLLYLLESGVRYDVEEVLGLARNDCREMPDNAGIVHLFADIYVTACEKADRRQREELISGWGKDAWEAVDRAIELDDSYAKYYCTKGRMMALEHRYSEAENLISQAINREDSGREDYTIRLMNYQYHRIMIQMNRKLYEAGVTE